MRMPCLDCILKEFCSYLCDSQLKYTAEVWIRIVKYELKVKEIHILDLHKGKKASIVEKASIGMTKIYAKNKKILHKLDKHTDEKIQIRFTQFLNDKCVRINEETIWENDEICEKHLKNGIWQIE